MGDLDGDGLQDLLVGAPSFADIDFLNQTGLSYALVLSAATGNVLTTLYPASPACATCMNTRFGWSVSGGGDLDGDGTPDLVIGESAGPFPGPGLAVHSGASWATLYETFLSDGWTVRLLGDVDGDGFDDYLGCDIYSCALIGGSLSCGRAMVYSGSDGGLIFTLRRQASVAFGADASAPGDVDGDDIPDVLVGDNQYPPGSGISLGRITMFSLAPTGTAVFGTGCAGPAPGVPRIGVRNGPTPGGTTTIHVSKAAPGVGALLLLGLSNTQAGTTPLPFELGGLAMSGCFLRTSADFVYSQFTQAGYPAPGRASVAFPIPSSTSLVGSVFFAQWFVGGSAVSPIPGSMTRAVQLTIL